jgi:DivIVA domain-containing protein
VAGVHTMSRTDLPRTRTNPHEVRRKNFSVRLRGVDPGEVRSFLTGLADELEGIQTQVAVLTQENQSLRAQLEDAGAKLEEAHVDPMENATDQAVSVLNQAQQLADSLIDEAMQSARDLLLTARSQQRDIMEQAKVAANGAVNRATAVAEQAGSQDASVRDVEYIRMFAKVAQVQFQAVLDALNEQVTRLGEVPAVAEPLRTDSQPIQTLRGQREPR